MKRCPECGREYDTSMMFCLDDGAELLYGPASMDEPTTALLHETGAPGEAPTRLIDPHATAPPKSPTSSEPQANTHIASNKLVWVLGGLTVVVLRRVGLPE